MDESSKTLYVGLDVHKDSIRFLRMPRRFSRHTTGNSVCALGPGRCPIRRKCVRGWRWRIRKAAATLRAASPWPDP